MLENETNHRTPFESMGASFLSRFWKKVDLFFGITDEDCWNWTASTDKGGYGLIHLSGKIRVKAHRAAWTIYKGPIPESIHVLHSCDNPACINPRHLWLGTNLENQQDKIKKGRHVQGDKTNISGEQSHFAKLKKEQVLMIREIYKSGSVTYVELAKQFKISMGHVGAIITGACWKSSL